MSDRDLIDGLRDKADDANEPDAGLLLDAAARLEELIATDWRSVRDESPGLKVKVDGYGISGLDYHMMRRVMVVYRDHSGRYMEDRGARAFPAVVTHWRPRPAPPKLHEGSDQ